jgi:hypothetical protein
VPISVTPTVDRNHTGMMSGEIDFEAWFRAISPESFEDDGFIADDCSAG